MKERLSILGRLSLFWIVFMITSRIIFLFYHLDQTSQLTRIEISKVMLYGLKMDLSMTGYMILVSGIMLSISVLIRGKWIVYFITGFNLLFLVFSCLAVVLDLELYRHWGFRLNTTPFYFMGSEAAGSASAATVIKLITILIVLLVTFFFSYFKFIAPSLRNLTSTTRKAALVLALTSVLMLMPIRGSFGASNMNVGFVYFHKTNNFANHAGINVIWNFLNILYSNPKILYPEDYFDKQLTEEYLQRLYPKDDSTEQVLTTRRPNVIIILIESFTANVVEVLGGKKGVTPNFNELSKEGILFDNFYATGDRTAKGLIGVLSGYPCQTQRSIIQYPSKTQKLSFLSKELESIGYNTSFVYGGDADFSNFRSYLTNAGFGHITSEDDFSDDLNNSKWGVPDQYLFEQAQRELDTIATDRPFFKALLTLSSHEPFDVPLKHIQGEDEESLFFNSCYYTDKYLGEFIEYSKQQPWWDNTVIIITADHGHRLPGKIGAQVKERFHVPLLWLGGAIKKDTVIHTLSGHTDIANTLLGQITQPSSNFIFSKNIFGNNARDFAMYIFNDGYGYLTPEHYFIYDNSGNLYLREEGNFTEEDKNYPKAYLQKLYSDFNSKK